ncbi:MAG: ribosome biogenesis GTPase YlqF [Ruminococcaceae bacterium]|nr:ribosome biogenesis GTPase YlqF [Oscillospiraceae bacterium]
MNRSIDTFNNEVRESSNIQWFPGHMAKARRLLSENLKLVDVVVELVDSRIPFSSRNPEIDKLIQNKPRVIIGNKKDLADPVQNSFWANYYAARGTRVYFTDCKTGGGSKEVVKAINEMMAEKTARYLEKGRKAPIIKAMIVGIPNVGKSSLINKIAGSNVAITGDKPGVTRNKQWLKMSDNIYLLDTPGLLWPKFDDQIVGYKLAATGAIKNDVLDVQEIAIYLIRFMSKYYPQILKEKYSIENTSDVDFPSFESGLAMLEAFGRKRGCIVKKGEVDLYRASMYLLDDYRKAKFGRISLDNADCLGEHND